MSLAVCAFAGHPTLGSCHAWLQAGGVARGQEIIQECEIGLVRIRRDSDELAFIAPPLLRSGVVEASLLERVRVGLGLAPERYVVSQGTAIGRAGRIRIERQGSEIWVGGAVSVCIEGHLQL